MRLRSSSIPTRPQAPGLPEPDAGNPETDNPSRENPGTENPDAAVTLPVQRAYRRYAAQADRWTQDYSRRGGTVHCQAGCFHCCDFPVRISLAEGLLTASALSQVQLRAMATRAAEVLANARASQGWDEYFRRHRLEIGYCPLLDPQSGGCTAYEVRPTRCRDTFSALSAHYCRAGTLERMDRREEQAYRTLVARTPGTDGESHYIAPLEDLSEPVGAAASRAMRTEWGLEVWGDFPLLVTLSQDPAFMAAVRGGQAGAARRRARRLGLEHPELLEIG